jgi:hypothetical protein
VSGFSAVARGIGGHGPSEGGEAKARSHGWSFARLLIYAQAAHREFVDLDLAQPGLANLQPADGQGANGQGPDSERADSQRPYANVPSAVAPDATAGRPTGGSFSTDDFTAVA